MYWPNNDEHVVVYVVAVCLIRMKANVLANEMFVMAKSLLKRELLSGIKAQKVSLTAENDCFLHFFAILHVLTELAGFRQWVLLLRLLLLQSADDGCEWHHDPNGRR